MSFSILQSSNQLFQPDFLTFHEDIVQVATFLKTVYLVNNTFTQPDLNAHANSLQFGLIEHWFVTSQLEKCGANTPILVPKLCISLVLLKPRPDPIPEALVYIGVMEGCNNAERAKLIIKFSLEALGASMFHEAMNGCSVVFSGIMLRSEGLRLIREMDTKRLWKFFRVDGLKELRAMKDSQANKERIGVWC